MRVRNVTAEDIGVDDRESLLRDQARRMKADGLRADYVGRTKSESVRVLSDCT